MTGLNPFMQKPPAYKRMASGKYIDLNNFTEKDVSITDINTALNSIVRFGGHYKERKPLTVAQHTNLVVALSKRLFPDEPEVHFDSLLHDFPETYYGDVATPLKQIFGDVYRNYVRGIDGIVYNALWKDYPYIKDYNIIHQKTKICDMLALDIERRAMWDSQIGKSFWPVINLSGIEKSAVEFSMEEKLDMFSDVAKYHPDLEQMYKKMK